MNIFVLSTNPRLSAEMMCDKHVVKMIVESAQMLINPFLIQGHKLESLSKKGEPYKVSHKNHPCSVWVRNSRLNFMWLKNHLESLLVEYKKRYNKTHRIQKIYNEIDEKWILLGFENLFQTPFQICVPDKYKSETAEQSYRRYYLGEKSKFAKWKTGVKPFWWNK